jgi:hypothetical protein
MRNAIRIAFLLVMILAGTPSAAAQPSGAGKTVLASISLKQPVPIQQALQSAIKNRVTILMVEADFLIGSQPLHDFYVVPPHTNATQIEQNYADQRMAFFADISSPIEKTPNFAEKHSAELQNTMETQAKAVSSAEFQQQAKIITISKMLLRGDANTINQLIADTPEAIATTADEKALSERKPQAEQGSADAAQKPDTASTADTSRWNPEVGVSYTYPHPNGGRYSYQWMWWDEIPFSSNQTYEHDFFLYNYNNDGTYLNGSDSGYPGCFPIVEYAATTWPAESKPYLDTRFAANYVSCERDELAYTIGAAQADKLTANTWHYTYIRTKDGNVDTDKFRLSGQLGHRTPSLCYSTWCSFGDESRTLVPAWSYSVPGTRWWWARTASSCAVFLAQYFNNRALEGDPRFSRCEGSVNKNWGYGGPSYDVPNDNFSARWEGNFYFADDDYTFTAYVDDGVRIWVDDGLILDKWFDQSPTQYTFNHRMSAGTHKVKIEYFENGGQAIAQVRWQRYVATQPIVVDEMGAGFTKGGAYWWDDWSRGAGNHMYWTCVNGNVVDSWAEWRPNLLAGRNYQVIAYIPNYHTNTTSAKYEIHHQYGTSIVTLSQLPYYDQWVSLGTYSFAAGNGGYVRLTDATGETPSCGTQIGFDALAWIPR